MNKNLEAQLLHFFAFHPGKKMVVVCSDEKRIEEVKKVVAKIELQVKEIIGKPPSAKVEVQTVQTSKQEPIAYIDESGDVSPMAYKSMLKNK